MSLRHKSFSLLSPRFASTTSSIKEPLYNSMSDGFYEVRSSSDKQQAAGDDVNNSTSRPTSRVARSSLASLSEPEILHNSMSDGLYEYRRARAMLSNSLSEPEYLGNSMSDAFYEGRPGRSRTSTAKLAGQGYKSARLLPMTQRIVSRSSIYEPPLLHDSFSHSDYPHNRN